MSARVQSVERAAAILQVLADEHGPVSLAHLSAALGLAKATVHGLVQTLREVGFVDQDPVTGLYAVGAELLHLGATPLDRNELRARALNWTDALAGHTGESALVARLEDGEVMIAHHVFRPDTSQQSLQTGSSRPLHATALGKVLLAHDPRASRTLAGRQLESHTYRTVTDPGRLHRELADVRDLGWAASVEEWRPGHAGLAAPVRDRSGFVIGAVGIEGRADALCDGHLRPRATLVKHVMDAGRWISRELGHGRHG
ncbi:IclR family transcriptional regulator [Nocardioides mesophilus]|uniref:Glycerol operon regulatory protein n=1 Tax=Nocardioides mesophilus TaxID=433659 RepID=A0A7G9REQ5_9ACTN|nr:IclR family transcriptional regulator [Nocardioides mesophilus]QNN54080.1 IclR family transcriptional regulator [Nocardioides mesophilus]